MASKSRLLFAVLAVLVFASCKKSYTPLEYKQWIESDESGFKKKKTIGSLEYEMQYQTREYLLLLNNGPEAFEKEINIAEEMNNYSEDVQVLFTIRNLDGIPPLEYNVQDEMEYYARIQYLNSKVSNDFFLVSNETDTAKCMFAHLERDFGISPEIRLNLAFNLQNPVNDFRFCYNDKLFNNGMIKFSMSADELNDLPELRNN